MVYTETLTSQAKMLMDIKGNSPHRDVRMDTLNMPKKELPNKCFIDSITP